MLLGVAEHLNTAGVEAGSGGEKRKSVEAEKGWLLSRDHQDRWYEMGGGGLRGQQRYLLTPVWMGWIWARATVLLGVFLLLTHCWH